MNEPPIVVHVTFACHVAVKMGEEGHLEQRNNMIYLISLPIAPRMHEAATSDELYFACLTSCSLLLLHALVATQCGKQCPYKSMARAISD